MPPHKSAIYERYVLYLHVSSVFTSFNSPTDKTLCENGTLHVGYQFK